jgi:hypothetical protein
MIPEEDRTAETDEKPVGDARSPHARGKNVRACFYWSLVLFIVLACLLLLAVPVLRSRLVQRSRDLYGAIWGTRAPVMASVGDRQSAYPEEYERETPAFPDAGQGIPEDWIFRLPSSGAAEGKDGASSLISPPTESAKIIEPAARAAGKAGSEGDSGAAGQDSGIPYATGKAESEAYALLLKKFPKVAALVQGDDSSMQFISWGGSEVQEGVYWVRLIFEKGGNRDVYIWQVNMESGDVRPLSYNARTVS